MSLSTYKYASISATALAQVLVPQEKEQKNKVCLADSPIFSLCLSHLVKMADNDSSSNNNTSMDSKEKISEISEIIRFSEDEETLIIRMFNLVGERWSLIAGRIPGRTAEEIEIYWNSRYSTTSES